MRTGTNGHYTQERKTRVMQNIKIKNQHGSGKMVIECKTFRRGTTDHGRRRGPSVPSYTRGPDYLSDDGVSDSWISRARIT